MRKIQKINSRPIAVYPVYIELTGSVTAGLLLSQIMYWASKKPRFYKTNAELCRETCMSANELKTAKKRLEKVTFLTVIVEGIPAKTWYEVDWDSYEKWLTNDDQSETVENSVQLVGWNPTNCEAGIQPTVRLESNQLAWWNPTNITKTTAKTTTETTAKTTGSGKDNPSKTPKSAATWEAYSDAYRQRYGVDPIRNAKTNRLLCSLVDQVGADRAPELARHYVTMNDRFFCKRGHDVGTLLSCVQQVILDFNGVAQNGRTAANKSALDAVNDAIVRGEL